MARRASLNDYLAAQRTFLAWIRTGLALMGFGFVVARFGLFLQEFQTVERTLSVQPYGLSLWFGTALIAAGVAVNVFAGWRYATLVRGLDSGETEHLRFSVRVAMIAYLLAFIGLAMAVYLVLVGIPKGSKPEKSKSTSMMSVWRNGQIVTASHHVDATVPGEFYRPKEVSCWLL